MRAVTKPSRSRAALLAVLAAVLAAGVVTAASIDAPATVSAPADRVARAGGDVVAIYDVEAVDAFVVDATFRAAEQTGAAAAAGRTGSLGMVRLARSGTTVHAAPSGYLIPIVYLGLPRAAVAGVIGTDVSSVLDPNSLVMNELTAQLMGARSGDVLELRAVDGSTQSFVVAGIRPYAQVGGAEVVMTTEAVERLGAEDDTRTLIWNITSRQAIDSALQAVGLIDRPDTKVDRSWDSPDPDDTLSTARAKAQLGEPWYRVLADGSLEMHPTWKDTYLTDGRVLLDATIRVWARCHVGVVAGLGAALAEVAASGLAGAIDVANTNTYGGCFAPRYSRTSGFLSRHTYAIALDMNTTSNCLGCTPRMNCDVVRIFRKHGFAWGGNFRRPDGMHFEWVGQPRHQIAYPSRYCPNIVDPLGQSSPSGDEIGNEVLTAGMETV